MNIRSIESKILDGKKLSVEEEEFLTKKITDYWEDHPDVVNRFPKWRKYIAWVAGYQLVDYNRVSKQLMDLSGLPNAERARKLVFNKLRPFVRQLSAKMAADTPNPGVMPNTTEEEDIEAARIGDMLIEGVASKIGFNDQINDLKLWVILTNRGFLRVFWNEDDYGVLGYDKSKTSMGEETGVEPLQEIGNTNVGEQKTEVREEGDVMIESVPPFNCRVDPLYNDRRKWRWFIYGELADADVVEEKYGLVENSLQDDSDLLDNAYDMGMHEEQDLLSAPPAKQKDVSGRTVIFKEMWTPKIFAFVAGKKLVDYGTNTYEEIPFFLAEDKLIPIDNYEKGYTYNESVVKDAIPIQREYNKHMSMVSMALDRASKIKVMNPLGSMISKKQFTNDIGTFIDFNPRSGASPYQLKLEPLPGFTPMYKADLEREFENTFSAHEASFGHLPERASHASGTLMNLLLEQDDIVLNPLIARINNAISDAWSLALKIIQENYTVARLIKCMGEDEAPYVMKFRGADLHGNTDVRITSQSGLPKSRALRIEYVMRLRQAGLLPDDKTNLEMLQLGNVEKIYVDALLHERKAYRENMLITENPNIDPRVTPTWIYQLDDDNSHLKIHLRLRLGSRYDKFNDIQKQALEAHIEATYKKIMQAQQQMQQQMMQQAVTEHMMLKAQSGQAGQQPPPQTSQGQSGGGEAGPPM
jgi:hypothetical protein